MAVPKRKTSKSRRDKRRSSVWKLDVPAFSKCSNPHRVCKNCGFYKAQEVIKHEA